MNKNRPGLIRDALGLLCLALAFVGCLFILWGLGV